MFWVLDRRVFFCERVGSCVMEAVLVSKLEELYFFFRYNSDLDLYRFFGVRRGVSTFEVFKAFRMKVRTYYLDKFSYLSIEE